RGGRLPGPWFGVPGPGLLEGRGLGTADQGPRPRPPHIFGPDSFPCQIAAAIGGIEDARLPVDVEDRGPVERSGSRDTLEALSIWRLFISVEGDDRTYT